MSRESKENSVCDVEGSQATLGKTAKESCSTFAFQANSDADREIGVPRNNDDFSW